MKPKLLILDEPFANLDFRSIHNHLIILEQLRKEEHMTILFTSHNLFFVENWAEKILVLDNGKGVFEGMYEEGIKIPKIKNLLGSYDEIRNLLEKKPF